MSDSQPPSGRARVLVETDWLAANLERPDLRVLDCTVHAARDETGRLIKWTARPDYDAGHIPGAHYADLVEALRDRASPYPSMLPDPGAFAAEMSALGVGDDTMVVVYSSDSPSWASRLWWMLRVYGHDRVFVLDGGLAKWAREGRPLEAKAPEAAPAVFTPRYRPELVAGKDEVEAAIGAPGATLINALSAGLYRGEEDGGYGRLGHIASSVNLPAGTLLDSASGRYLADEALAEFVDACLRPGTERVICYCGGGIAATTDALVLELLGHDNVAVYDASLSEWARDPDLPMEAG